MTAPKDPVAEARALLASLVADVGQLRASNARLCDEVERLRAKVESLRAMVMGRDADDLRLLERITGQTERIRERLGLSSGVGLEDAVTAALARDNDCNETEE